MLQCNLGRLQCDRKYASDGCFNSAELDTVLMQHITLTRFGYRVMRKYFTMLGSMVKVYGDGLIAGCSN
jgi:hypothetical protein